MKPVDVVMAVSVAVIWGMGFVIAMPDDGNIGNLNSSPVEIADLVAILQTLPDT